MISREPEVIKGAGVLHKIPEMLKSSGQMQKSGPKQQSTSTSVLVATTPGFIRRGTLESFFEELRQAGIAVTVFSEVVPDPTIECVEAMVTKYVLGNCQAFVAIGGGSVIDCAKAAAARIACPGKQIRDMKGLLKIHTKLPDFYAVPTTAGTGSEATAASVVTDTVNGSHYKYAISDPCLIPKYAVLDPELAIDLPPHITAATGMDALTHAVEAYTNKYPSKLVREMALNSVKLIYENLPVAFALEPWVMDEAALKARENMLLASYEAGVAFTNNFVGYVHAVAHGVGALYGIPHGQANAIILPYVLEQFGDAAVKPLAELADAAGLTKNVEMKKEAELTRGVDTTKRERLTEADERKLAAEFIDSIRRMNEAFGIPARIEELKEEDFETLIDRAIAEANYTYPVPQIWGREEFRNLLKKLTRPADRNNI